MAAWDVPLSVGGHCFAGNVRTCWGAAYGRLWMFPCPYEMDRFLWSLAGVPLSVGGHCEEPEAIEAISQPRGVPCLPIIACLKIGGMTPSGIAVLHGSGRLLRPACRVRARGNREPAPVLLKG